MNISDNIYYSFLEFPEVHGADKANLSLPPPSGLHSSLRYFVSLLAPDTRFADVIYDNCILRWINVSTFKSENHLHLTLAFLATWDLDRLDRLLMTAEVEVSHFSLPATGDGVDRGRPGALQ